MERLETLWLLASSFPRFVYAETLKPDLGGLFWQLGCSV